MTSESERAAWLKECRRLYGDANFDLAVIDHLIGWGLARGIKEREESKARDERLAAWRKKRATSHKPAARRRTGS